MTPKSSWSRPTWIGPETKETPPVLTWNVASGNIRATGGSC